MSELKQGNGAMDGEVGEGWGGGRGGGREGEGLG